MGAQLTHVDFLSRSQSIHGTTYDYSKARYHKAREKVKIICRVHGLFLQTPSKHMHGIGCPTCGRAAAASNLAQTNEEFISRAKAVHGAAYSYADVVYINARKNVQIRCKKHKQPFLQSPDAHLAGQGCPLCGMDSRKVSLSLGGNEFIRKARRLHGYKYSYPNLVYVNAHTPVTIACRVHGTFTQLPNKHLSGRGCGLCGTIASANKQRRTTSQFIAEARMLHGTLYHYSRCAYFQANTKVIVTCRTHGDFLINPTSHLHGAGCPACKSTRHSKIAIRWLEDYARSHRLKGIQHGNNGGEFHICGTPYRVDGYHPASNTVFEFYGDAWHGNPKLFKPSERCNPFSALTAKQLYRNTLLREQEILDLGYNIIFIWESDYRATS